MRDAILVDCWMVCGYIVSTERCNPDGLPPFPPFTRYATVISTEGRTPKGSTQSNLAMVRHFIFILTFAKKNQKNETFF